MTHRKKVVMSWSGGKDSALALYELLKTDDYEVVALLTSLADEYRRISHHGVREELLDRQAEAVGIPLHKLYLPAHTSLPCTHGQFEEIMRRVLLEYRDRDVSHVAHGDLFLEDLRQYRERNLARVGMKGLFPLWHRNTTEVIHTFIQLGFRARICCVEEKLGRRFVGRSLDLDLLRDLPENIDPCGEYGEYHSFVHDGPIFSKPVRLKRGQIVHRETRYYVDLIPLK